ncbi:NAD-dependent succinate-semialdehyde dehydrogenase [Sphingomonas sp. BGYR3]|uniref:NAD-dependent succinate-semialdehyde dehydrogenase n=1 Tax=Sphingomonas sp. BGYR3 TaxID=2975483 RepID=UPI0021A5EC34|nr:NAD-dependent succinate-semialdehyde dehydrogenase [Sphingomonas sp. BGYR3]MDG5489027.1 NAD-dependent succinate-semialdehyde dehydrogenase [Sphingomonas sp. BGYR3]
MSDLIREAALIDGEWVSGDGWIDVDDPATGRIIGRVPDLGEAETDRAIAAAAHAMAEWRQWTAAERARVIRRIFDLMMQHQDALGELMTLEQGKPLAEAKGEIAYAASFFEWFAEEGKRAYGDVIPGHQRDKRIVVLKQPVGVVAAITPWNFPAAMIARKLAPTLAAGCGMVLKPALQTPFSALAIGALALEAGLPKGLFNIVTGDSATIGGVLTSDPRVAKLSFTGSTATGAKLMAQCAPTIKKLSLELGGNAPFIVFDDADLDAAVEGAIQSKYRNNGQTCVCANRIYAQAGIHDAFVEKLAAAASKLKPAPGTDPDAKLGPLIDKKALEKVEAHVADALEKGATLVTGGRRADAGALFYEPTVLTGVTADMIATQEETFGPVAPVLKFETEEQVIAAANDSPFGLSAYFYARDLSRVWRVAEAIEAGMIGINTGLISTEVAPFGGVKQSGMGREGSLYGLDDYLETKYLCIGI